jgi:hypothetical protein
MASVALEFSAPFHPDLAELKIYEASEKDGPYTLIETVTEIGETPDYINSYTTDQAQNVENWFSIQWVDSKGAESQMSNPWKGNTDSIVSLITDRVLQRESTANADVVMQEAEAIAEQFFEKDPYTVELPVSYRVLTGLTYLTLAAVISGQVIQAGGGSFTAGLVSMKVDNGTKLADLKAMVTQGMKYLGLSVSRVAQMKPVCIAGGMSEVVEFDLSRLVIDVA